MDGTKTNDNTNTYDMNTETNEATITVTQDENSHSYFSAVLMGLSWFTRPQVSMHRRTLNKVVLIAHPHPLSPIHSSTHLICIPLFHAST